MQFSYAIGSKALCKILIQCIELDLKIKPDRTCVCVGVYVGVELEDNCSVRYWLSAPCGGHICQKKRNFCNNHKFQDLIGA